MNLFEQAIEEYLRDNHPDWKIFSPDGDTIYIGTHKIAKGLAGYSITVHTTQQMIGVLRMPCIPYTDYDILAQITKAINYME